MHLFQDVEEFRTYEGCTTSYNRKHNRTHDQQMKSGTHMCLSISSLIVVNSGSEEQVSCGLK
jgi:hypothetical protein